MPPSKRSRYSTTRQKACQSCSNAKAKCDRKETCSRCASRGLTCSYPGSESRDTSILEGLGPSEVLDVQLDLQTPNSIVDQRPQTPVVQASEQANEKTLDFTGLELACPINSDDIKNRWLNSYVPLAGQTVKNYSPSVMNFVYRMLKSYASMVVRGHGVPPFIHSSQVTLTPALSTCFTLARICENPLPGSESVATDILQREMTRLYEEHETYDDINLLGLFQAYLIYTMVLFFHPSPAMPFLRQAMINLQEIACSTSRQGLVCLAEQKSIRPRWEAWVVVEAKRRTLFTMYFLDNVLSAQDGLPTYIGYELHGLYAPSSKALWQADARREWERRYNSHLVEWVDGIFQLDELWPIPANMSEEDIDQRRRRVDRWLEGVDEYGTMLYAATSCTHGG